LKRTWIGSIRSSPNSRAVFTSLAGLTAATIQFPNVGLLILPDGRIWKQESRLSCGTPEPAPDTLSVDTSSEQAIRTTAAMPWEITLALPFSKRAADIVGGVTALRTILFNQQDFLNESLRVSGLSQNLRIKVVAPREVDYDESNPKKNSETYVSTAFRSFMKNNHADLLLLVAAKHPRAGLAGSACQYTGSSSCSTGILDLTQIAGGVGLHELGHLLSATHEAGWYACPSHGQLLGKDFETVMWQDGTPAECSAERLMQFSNPAVIYLGSGVPTGNTAHCNACRIRTVAQKVSNFRK
jgi:hypothetical protein